MYIYAQAAPKIMIQFDAANPEIQEFFSDTAAQQLTAITLIAAYSNPPLQKKSCKRMTRRPFQKIVIHVTKSERSCQTTSNI